MGEPILKAADVPTTLQPTQVRCPPCWESVLFSAVARCGVWHAGLPAAAAHQGQRQSGGGSALVCSRLLATLQSRHMHYSVTHC